MVGGENQARPTLLPSLSAVAAAAAAALCYIFTSLTGHFLSHFLFHYQLINDAKANHLITINYTMPNETVISTHSIGDEFSGLSSTIIDPITGAFYDRYANELYFFKGRFEKKEKRERTSA